MSNESHHDLPAMRHDVSDLARDVYLEFLGREVAGNPADFEALCRERPGLAAELRRLRQAILPPAGETRAHPPDAAPGARTPEEESGERELVQLLNRISQPSRRADRYRRGAEVGRGSMGRVFSAWDKELVRVLALKVLHTSADGDAPRPPTDRVLRFIREAQITSQLDHPGVVPVHELGIDADGRPFFAMKLVRGQDLKSVFTSTWAGKDGWTLVRALGVILKVCEAMGYAHAKGIVHRDLKPTNIMVGRFGEVFVMDWGVAHVEEHAEDGLGLERTAFIRATRRSAADDATLTDDGTILGTAAYMSPEQAEGNLLLLGAWTDVYAVGTLLYHLLAKRPPYIDESSSRRTLDVLERLRAGPPEPLARAAPDAPAELVSICERAMARQPFARYQGMKELAEDLQAYLEGRVVRAHRTGVRAELRKWVLRNRTTAVMAALALVIVSGAGLAISRWRGDRAQLDLLQRLREPSSLTEQFDYLWPATIEHIGRIREWLAAAEGVAQQREVYRAQLADLRKRALPEDPGAPEELRARALYKLRIGVGKKTIAYFQSERERLRRFGGLTFEGYDLAKVESELVLFDGQVIGFENKLRATPRQSWTFVTAGDDLLHDRLARIDRELDELSGDAEARPRIEVAERVLAAYEHAERSRPTGADSAWEEATRCIGDPTRCPQYAGLHLRPLEHLVPLGPDPRSGLWEFAQVLTGEIPIRGPDGVLEIDEGSAVVLVLVPGGSFRRGSQMLDEGLPNYDPYSQRIEQPVLGIQIDGFLLSKFELTMAQWERLTGKDLRSSDDRLPGSRMKPAMPMTWDDGLAVLRCVGLDLPSEAQWEYAARAGTTTPWWTGAEMSALPDAANLGEQQPSPGNATSIEDFIFVGPDGWNGSAPIGLFHANPFGLHDVLGNAAEFTRDVGSFAYSERNILIGTGESAPWADLQRRARGGNHASDPRDARCASRVIMSRNEVGNVGLRPSLDLGE